MSDGCKTDVRRPSESQTPHLTTLLAVAKAVGNAVGANRRSVTDPVEGGWAKLKRLGRDRPLILAEVGLLPMDGGGGGGSMDQALPAALGSGGHARPSGGGCRRKCSVRRTRGSGRTASPVRNADVPRFSHNWTAWTPPPPPGPM